MSYISETTSTHKNKNKIKLKRTYGLGDKDVG